MLYLTVAGLASATGTMEATPNRGFAGIGVFFIIIGNYIGKVTRNSYVGVRTPWTLASDRVWERAHRFAGPEFMIGGVLLVLASLATTSGVPPLCIVFATTLIPVIYSYIVSRRGPGTPPP
jgi:uncharacterized membrane protein